ncbi:hypothetical protein ETD83_36505 [Actinomadura soli]|uniref:Uncharacterized protein n=1 Tax=Actinomadura soli TaxID=2508997 RepID=A0A5C4J125_9ACTN|nr:hypothetical protein [Actinomadura soli]TMQ90198.1 hypothetical protein ETD83_36505 [Actinomadura soli]
MTGNVLYNAYENGPEVKRLKNAAEGQDGDSWAVRCPARARGTACIGTGVANFLFRAGAHEDDLFVKLNFPRFRTRASRA